MRRQISLVDALPYLRAMDGQTLVIKVGGAVCARPTWHEAVIRDVAALHRLGLRVVVIHGGGPQLDQAAAARGLETTKVGGRRVTSPELLAAAIEVWRGAMSMSWVSGLRRQGERAVGICGVDGGLLTARRRPPMVLADDAGERTSVDFGEVGDLQEVDGSVLEALLDRGLLPVISPLASDREGQILNVNADTVAAHIAVALKASQLLLVGSVPGVLADPADPTSMLHWTDLKALRSLREQGQLTGGMRPKLSAMELALEGGVSRVHVVDGRCPGALLEEVLTTDGRGTLVTAALASVG